MLRPAGKGGHFSKLGQSCCAIPVWVRSVGPFSSFDTARLLAFLLYVTFATTGGKCTLVLASAELSSRQGANFVVSTRPDEANGGVWDTFGGSPSLSYALGADMGIQVSSQNLACTSANIFSKLHTLLLSWACCCLLGIVCRGRPQRGRPQQQQEQRR